MCGIIGVLNQVDSDLIVQRGLKHLEYRGYDSWGLVCNVPWAAPHHSRSLSKITESKYSAFEGSSDSIGHTRWATSGKPSIDTTHPVHSPAYDFYVVHNGIYDHNTNETHDTQVLIQEVVFQLDCVCQHQVHVPKNLILDCINHAMVGCGDNAALFMFNEIPNIIFGFSEGRNLYISDTGIISSDLNTLACLDQNTYRVHNHGAFAIETNQEGLFFCDGNYSGRLRKTKHSCLIKVPAYKIPSETKVDAMLSEIREQVNVPTLKSKMFHEPIFIGCGSSYYAGKFAKYHYRKHGLVAGVEYASEFEGARDINRTYVYITQSGETKDVIEKMGNFTNNILITNNANCSAKKRCDSVYNINAGPEISVAATKTFFNTCLLLIGLKPTQESVLKEYLEKNIPFWEKEVQKKVESLYKFDRCLFLGTGYTYPIAQEAALKMKEVAQTPSEGIPAAEVKHGPIALADENTLCIVVGELTGRVNENVSQLVARNAKILKIDDLMDNSIKELGPAYYALCSVIPCQLLAYYTALKMGLNPDRPRGLAKTVTV